MPVPIMAIITAASAAIDLAVKLIAVSKSLPDASSPFVLAELKTLEDRLKTTLAEVQAYTPKQV